MVSDPSVVAGTWQDGLVVSVYADAAAAGVAAADRVAAAVRLAVAERGVARVVFASAPSQVDTLRSLAGLEVPWARVEAFHMDEYVGLDPESPVGFGRWLEDQLLASVGVRVFHRLRPDPDPVGECARYSRLLEEGPLDAVVAGIGENGHLAFNDPGVADFADPLLVKVVELDERSRVQQVNDGQFERLEDVPRQAVTMTIPALLRSASMTCVVGGVRKAAAVAAALDGPIGPTCPASVLRRHGDGALFLDEEAAGEWSGRQAGGR